MRCSELVQLLEAVAVDDFFQLAVVVVVNAGISATEFQQFAVLLSVGMPFLREDARRIRIARVGELCPYSTQDFSPFLIGFNRDGRQLVCVVVKHIETVLQLSAMHRPS